MRKYTLAIVVLLVVMLALTSCELLFRRNKHIHEYSDAWSYDSNRHYHLCECGDVFDMADHIDGIIDGRCDVCGYKIANVYTVTLIVDEEIDTGAHAFSVREGETLSFLVTVPMGYTIGVEGADTVGDPVASSTGAGNIYTLRVSEVESDVTVYITTVSVTPRCNHEIIAYPTCTESGECLICGDNIGEPLGHAYADATCTSRSACTRCGDEIGDYEPHEYIAPTCDTPYTCSVCGATNGEALGHNFSTPTCTLPSSCDREGCGEIGDAPLGHTGGVPTCENGGVCLRCTSEYIPPLGHDMSEPTCTSASHCLRDGCDHTEGAKLPHTYDYTVTDPTCTSNGYTTYTCLDCGLKYIDHIIAALGHSWQAATCTTAKICAVCNTTDGTPLGHSWKAATCTMAKTCTVCNTTDGTPLGHSWQAATCTTAKTCTVCNATEGTALGHNWKAATCITAKTCTVCNATEGTELGHSWKAATCTTAKTCTACNTTEGTALGHNW